jgi:hypothetical protein
VKRMRAGARIADVTLGIGFCRQIKFEFHAPSIWL